MKNNYKDLSIKELTAEESKLRSELFNLTFQNKVGQLANTSRIREVKKEIARVKTVIRQRELGLAKAPEKEATKKSTKKTAKVDAEVKG